MKAYRKFYKSPHFQELLIFIAMFALTMLHEWMKLETFMDLLKGLVFFSLLYSQARFHRHFLFPKFLSKNYGVYLALTLLSTLVVSIILFGLDYYWIAPEIFQEQASLSMGIIYHFVLCIISTFTILSLFLVRQYSKELQKRNETQLLLSQMSLKFLHAQLNPHFFFNMFNNLYGVSLTEPARTPALILKLSELMRYQLESGNKEFADINEEIRFIENYVAMEKERVGKRCSIICQFPDEGALQNYKIATLILITLVENAFKHSVTIVGKWFVNIAISIQDDKLIVNISNSLADESMSSSSTGIGLQNIRERLKILYDGSYSLATIVERKSFQVTLTIKLSALIYG
jgi:two-component system LytT family sensor kinase